MFIQGAMYAPNLNTMNILVGIFILEQIRKKFFFFVGSKSWKKLNRDHDTSFLDINFWLLMAENATFLYRTNFI